VRVGSLEKIRRFIEKKGILGGKNKLIEESD